MEFRIEGMKCITKSAARTFDENIWTNIFITYVYTIQMYGNTMQIYNADSRLKMIQDSRLKVKVDSRFKVADSRLRS